MLYPLTHTSDHHIHFFFSESHRNMFVQSFLDISSNWFLKKLEFQPRGVFVLITFLYLFSMCVFSAQITCENNLKFDYNMQACNHTCLSLSGPDPRCGVEDAPVEGCGCLEGTHLNKGLTCSPKAQCPCSHKDSSIPTGPVVIDGRQWWVTVL